MKSFRTLILILLCLLLSSCKNSATTQPDAIRPISDASLDAQNKYAMFSVMGFQESDKFYLGNSMEGNHLFYYDKETGTSGLLCADPSCTHDGSSCGAYVQNGATMFLYDGMRYWITDDAQTDGADFILRRGEISGINRQKIKTISFEDIIIPYSPQQYAVHRGNLYFVGYTNRVHGVQTGNLLTLMQSPLDETEEFTALFGKTYEEDVHFDVRYIGDHAFLLVQIWKSDTLVDIELYRIALPDGETELIFETADVEYIDGFWVTEQEEVYLLEYGTGILSKLLNRKRVTIASLEHADDICKVLDEIVIGTYREDDGRYIEIIDFNGNPIYDGKMFTEEIPEMDADPNQRGKYGMVLVGGDSDKLIIGLQQLQDLSTEFYAIELDINNNMKPTLLWKQE